MKLPFNRRLEPIFEAFPPGWRGLALAAGLGAAWALMLLAIILAGRWGEVPFVYGQF